MNKINWFYNSERAQRSRWLCERFTKELCECRTLLDVGCSQSELKAYLPASIDYKGLDIAGNPDFKINLDQATRLPFEDLQFEAVVCADVLEHLENIHFVFDELCRIVSRYLIITLPNPAYGAYRYLFKKKYANRTQKNTFGVYMKYYGLPIEKPVDRHRWFYGYDEAVRFITYRSKKNSLAVKVVENNLIFENRFQWKKIIVNALKYINPNVAFRDLIFLIQKPLVHRTENIND